jgi:poly(3-hydroxybutyrate) depolymerase
MRYPQLELSSDGIARNAMYRDPRTMPPDAVIWLHGGNGNAGEFLDGIRSRPRVLDVAPQGLVTCHNPGWANLWEAEDDLPAGAPDNLIDVRFVRMLAVSVKVTFTSVRRVWLCGFSGGGGLVWSIWASANDFGPFPFSGLCAVGKKVRREPANSWAWKPGAMMPMPF